MSLGAWCLGLYGAEEGTLLVVKGSLSFQGQISSVDVLAASAAFLSGGVLLVLSGDFAHLRFLVLGC